MKWLSFVLCMILLTAAFAADADAAAYDSGVTDCQSLVAPTLTEVQRYHGLVDLTWDAIPCAESYVLGFSFVDGGFIAVSEVDSKLAGVSIKTRWLQGYVEGKEFHFAVIARRGGCESAWSNSLPVAGTSNLLAPVTGLMATKVIESVHLTWDASPGALFYLVERTEQGDLPGGWLILAAVPWNSPLAWDDPVVYDGVSYDYNVTAQTSLTLWQIITGQNWSFGTPVEFKPDLIPQEPFYSPVTRPISR